MTRYARAGSTQKHQRMPGDATTWQEMKTSAKKVPKVQKECLQEKKVVKKREINETYCSDTSQKPDSLHEPNSVEAKEKNQSPTKKDVKENNKIRNAKEEKSLTVASSTNLDNVDTSDSSDDTSQKPDLLNKPNSIVAKEKNQSPTKKDVNVTNKIRNAEEEKSLTVASSTNLANVDTSGLSRAQLKRLKKKRRIQEILAEQGIEIRGDKPYNQKKRNNSQEISDQSSEAPLSDSHENMTSENASEKKFSKKKSQFLERLKKRRMDNGITLLPSKVERKLYIMKRRFRETGVPPQAIKEIIRKERRKEENQFHKTLNAKPCFNCRQKGHLLSDCPLTSDNLIQDTGICFKCGSTEHVSYRCPNKKIEGFPLATCFICKEMGHVSKDCPKNEHGVYLNGGKCFLCGNINHYRSDCPSLKKKKKEEIEMTAHTINEVSSSIDAEITMENIVTPQRIETKKARIVKF